LKEEGEGEELSAGAKVRWRSRRRGGRLSIAPILVRRRGRMRCMDLDSDSRGNIGVWRLGKEWVGVIG